MAIAFDAASPADQFASATTLTFSHTCTGSDLVLLVVGACISTETITGVTYNGSALTQIGSTQSVAFGGKTLSLWAKVGPSTGAHDVVLTASSSTSIFGASVSYTGVAQTSTFGTAAQGENSSALSSVTVDVSSATGELVVDGMLWTSGDGSGMTAGSGQTKRAESEDAGTGTLVAMSEEAGASSVTMSWTQGSLERYGGVIGVSIKPASGSGSTQAPRSASYFTMNW